MAGIAPPGGPPVPAGGCDGPQAASNSATLAQSKARDVRE
jgi:hypothetical protein